jgi:alpha-tubulin suppressor-like RCC1 family protein
VSAVSVDGTTVTITGEDTSLDEAFEYVKIDETSYTEDITVDETSCGDGVSYDGEVEFADEWNMETPQTYAITDETSAGYAKKFSFDKTLTNGIKLSGGAEVKITAVVKLYLSSKSQYIEVKLNYNAKVNLSASGKSTERDFPLAYLTLSPIPGVFISFTPSVVVEVSGQVTVDGQLYGTAGFSASVQNGIKNLTTTPKLKAEVKAEVTVFVGISMKPEIKILSDKIADANMDVKLGAEAKGVLEKSTESSVSASSSQIHECTACVDGDIAAKASLNFTAKLLDKYTFNKTISYSQKIGDFYFSIDYGEFDLTTCPHNKYRTTISVVNEKGTKIKNAEITLSGGTVATVNEDGKISDADKLVTDEDGRAVCFLSGGNYKASTVVLGYVPKLKTFTVKNDTMSVEIVVGTSSGSGTGTGGNGEEGNMGSDTDEGSDIDEGSETDDVSIIRIENAQTFIKENHLCGTILDDGSLYMWGDNSFGQLGDGIGIDHRIPVKVLDNVTQITSKYGTCAAITEDGLLYMWGDNYNGQIGNNETDNYQYAPIKVLDHVISVSIDGYTSAAITEDGSLYMWGENTNGQVGNGTTEIQSTPIKVLDNVTFVSISNGCTGAITEDGSLYMWGKNSYGQVGNGTEEDQTTPQKILDNVVSISQNDYTTIAAITKDRSLYMWGHTFGGSIPKKMLDNVSSIVFGKFNCAAITQDGSLYMCEFSFYKVLDNVVSVSFEDIDENTFAAITKAGSLYMWGTNTYGEVGNGTTEEQSKPQKVLDNVASVSCSNGTSAAITKDGSLYMWGGNCSGQVGNGTIENQSIPQKILDNVVSVTLPLNGVDLTSAAITADGSLYMWGWNYFGQVGNGTTADQLTPFKVLDNVRLPYSAQQEYQLEAATYLGNAPTAVTTDGALTQASFDGLQADAVYNFYVMKDQTSDNAFGSDNLLYIDQVTTDDNGNLTVSYQPTAQCADADVFVVPMAQTDISDAQAQLSDLRYSGEWQYVTPTVTLNGVELTEGQDYDLMGDYMAKELGTYTVTVQGIGLYTGTVSITYNVLEGDDMDALVQEILNAKDGVTVEAQLYQTTTLSQQVLESLQGKNVTLDVTLPDETVWSICGTDVAENAADADLAVSRTSLSDGNLASDQITALVQGRSTEQLSFGQNGSYGFSGSFTLDSMSGAEGNKCVLVQNRAGKLTYTTSALIDNGTLKLKVLQGADSFLTYGTNGDTSGDGKVELADLMQLLHHVSKRTKLNEVNQGFADVNMDNAVNMQDLMRELHYVSGRNSTL